MNINEMIECVKLCLTKKYAQFEGRATRKEYWTYALTLGVFFLLLHILASIFISAFWAMDSYGFASGIAIFFDIIHLLLSLATIVPSIAVAVRRLHDIGRSGWYLLLMLIPIVGPIILLVFFCTDSKPDNQFGPNPKTSLQ